MIKRALVSLVVVAAMTATACGSDSNGGSDNASSGNQKQSTKEINVKPTGAANVKVGTNCGDTVPVGPKNKDGAAYQGMSQRLKDVYGSYPENIEESPWATQKITAKPPWKIGYITIGISNQYQNNVLKQLKEEFAEAKSKGLVTGDAANELLAEVLDLNTHISEYKSLTCDVRAGRRPYGPARRALVEDYRRRGNVLHESRHDSRGGN